MRAAICPAFNEALTIADIAPPVLGPGQVRIAVAAAALNFADTLMLTGKYQVKLTPPFVPGIEVAGTVLEVAEGVEFVRPGDRVMAVVTSGAFAEQAVADASGVFKLPDNLDLTLAAGFPVAYGTSHLGLTGKAALRRGETLLVHGASGGVGLTAVEIGAAIGARVIATASSPDKLAIAQAHGATDLIDTSAEDVRQRVKDLTGGRGADVVYDPVGGKLFDASLRAIAPDGRIVIIGFASGEVPQIPANLVLVKNISIIGFYWGAYQNLDPALFRKSMEEAIAWWAEGKLKPHVSAALPLADANQALDLLKSRGKTGKIVLTVA